MDTLSNTSDQRQSLASPINRSGLRTRQGKVVLKLKVGAEEAKLTCSCFTGSHVVNKNQVEAGQ